METKKKYCEVGLDDFYAIYVSSNVPLHLCSCSIASEMQLAAVGCYTGVLQFFGTVTYKYANFIAKVLA